MAPINKNSVLVREQWAAEVMRLANEKSYFSPFTRTGGGEAMIYRAGELNTGSGHVINFPAIGGLTDPVIVGDATGRGKGEKIRTFSTTLTAQRIRKVAQTDTGYDRHEAGLENELNWAGINSKLMPYFRNWYDQYVFDALQGTAARTVSSANEGRSTHGKQYAFSGTSPKFGWTELLDIERIAATGDGFGWGGSRGPLPAMSMEGAERMWMLFIDPDVYAILKDDTKFTNIAKDADVRGMANKLLAPVIGTVGQLMIVKAPRFHGTVHGNNDKINYQVADSDKNALARDAVGIDICGLRQYDDNNYWTGQESFDSTGELWSRCVLVGMHAIQSGFSGMPRYKTDDNNIDDLSDVALETWMGVQKTKWDPESRGDYDDAKVTNLDYAVAAVDVRVK